MVVYMGCRGVTMLAHGVYGSDKSGYVIVYTIYAVLIHVVPAVLRLRSRRAVAR